MSPSTYWKETRKNDMLIHLEKLGKSFGEKVVLHDVSASVEKEDRIGIVGQNGAGKTTLLKILCGVNRADDGTVDLLGGSPADAATRAKIGVVFEDAYFYESLTPAQLVPACAAYLAQRGMPVISPLCWSSSTYRRKRASKNSAAACG